MTTHKERVENPTNRFIPLDLIPTSFTPPLPGNITREIGALAYLARRIQRDLDIAFLANDSQESYTNPTLVVRNIPDSSEQKFIALDASTVTGRQLSVNIGSSDGNYTWDAWLSLN